MIFMHKLMNVLIFKNEARGRSLIVFSIAHCFPDRSSPSRSRAVYQITFWPQDRSSPSRSLLTFKIARRLQHPPSLSRWSSDRSSSSKSLIAFKITRHLQDPSSFSRSLIIFWLLVAFQIAHPLLENSSSFPDRSQFSTSHMVFRWCSSAYEATVQLEKPYLHTTASAP